MAEQKELLDGLREMTQEAFSGLHVDETMRLHILRAAREPEKERRTGRMPVRLVPAACALLILTIGGTAALHGRQIMNQHAEISKASDNLADSVSSLNETKKGMSVSTLQSIRAGGTEKNGLSERTEVQATLQTSIHRADTLFETSGREIPVICLNGAAYQLLKEPEELQDSQTGKTVGTVSLVTETPSLEVGSAETLSDCTEADEKIYCVDTLPVKTAIAARTDGKMRLFQRVSYAGFGLEGDTLSDVLGIGGQIREMTLSSAGTLSGDDAEKAFAVLLDKAVCTAEEAEPGEDTLTIVLKDGLKLQMTVSGNTLIGCGAWQCPEFFEAFRRKLQ